MNEKGARIETFLKVAALVGHIKVTPEVLLELISMAARLEEIAKEGIEREAGL